MDEQISTASTSQRQDTNNFVPFETCVETPRLERTLDEDIIGMIFIHSYIDWSNVFIYLCKLYIEY